MSIRRILASAAVLVTVAAAGNAQSLIDQAVSQLTEQGYSRIEVKRLGTTVKVEAQKGDRELEVVYDSATGDILKQEVNQIRDTDDTTPGVYISGRGDDNRSDRSRGRGGRLADDSSDDGVGHDVGDDHGDMGNDDDHGNDHGGMGNDDDHGDDHGGMGNDDDRDDDHGGMDNDDDRDDDHGGMNNDDDHDDDRDDRAEDDDHDDSGRGRGRGRGRSSDDD